MEKNVLLISIATPPTGGSHATRVTAVIEGIAARGIHVSVLTCETPSALTSRSSLYSRIRNVASVFEAKGGFVRTAATSVGSLSKSRARLAAVIQSLRAFVRKRILPDTFVTWIPGAVIEGVKQAKLTPFDIIISSGAPFSSHIAAFIVSKLTGIPLALDYGDPWVYEPGRPRRGIRLFVERELERVILSRSAIVSLTTPQTIDLYRRKYPGLTLNFHLMPMGFDGSDYASSIESEVMGIQKLTFVYAGRINEEYRTLDGLIEVLNAQLDNGIGRDVEFVFYGAEFDSIRSALAPYLRSKLVRLEKELEHESYIKVIREADGLIIFGNNSEVQVPGKIAHYLAARRPILYFSNMASLYRDPSYCLLKRVMNSHLYLGNEVVEYFKFRDCCAKKETPRVDESALQSLEWKSICSLYVDSVLRVTNRY